MVYSACVAAGAARLDRCAQLAPSAVQFGSSSRAWVVCRWELDPAQPPRCLGNFWSGTGFHWMLVCAPATRCGLNSNGRRSSERTLLPPKQLHSARPGADALQYRLALVRTPATLIMSVNIEVERKFVLSPELARRLVDVLESETGPFEARRLRSTRFTDVYYDTPDTWALTLRDWWLRQRQAQWQLKVPWRDGPRVSALDTYRELERPAELEATLGWCPDAALRDGHIQPFARIATERDTFQVTYRGHVLRIDLDRADFGYAVGEIEVLVQESRGEHDALKNPPPTAVAVSSAEHAIRFFAKEMDIAEPEAAVRGKLAEYIRRFRPEHYAALVRHHILDARDASPHNQLDRNQNENAR